MVAWIGHSIYDEYHPRWWQRHMPYVRFQYAMFL